MNPFKRHNPPHQGPAPTPAPSDAAPGDAHPAPAPGEAGGAHQGDPDATAALIDEIQAELARVRAEADQLRAERDAAQHAHKLALADFQNFQRRARANEQTAQEQGVRGVLHSIIPVIDHFQLALAQDPSTGSVRQLVDGVALIRDELLRALSTHGVSVINPQRGEPFDPARHQALLHQPAEGVAPGSVVMCLRQGFAVEERLVRPAEVSVAAEPGAEARDGAGQPDDGATERR